MRASAQLSVISVSAGRAQPGTIKSPPPAPADPSVDRRGRRFWKTSPRHITRQLGARCRFATNASAPDASTGVQQSDLWPTPSGYEGYLIPFTLVMMAQTSDHVRGWAAATAAMTARPR